MAKNQNREPDWLVEARRNGLLKETTVNRETLAAAATPIKFDTVFAAEDKDGQMSEARFQALVVGVAEAAGWEVYHTHDSRGSKEGFPDLTMWRGRKCCFAELKKRGEEPTEEQVRVMEGLAATGNDVFLWRPENWSQLVNYLTGG